MKNWLLCLTTLAGIGAFFPQQALAVVPVVKTVPWDATNFASPHFTYSGKVITLKGTSNVQGANFHYDWDPAMGARTAPVR